MTVPVEVPVRIPFNKPHLPAHSLTGIEQALRTKNLSGNGAFTARTRDALREITGARHVILTTSCTHALEMCALLLNLQPGDEVILPSFTFVSTANAFVLRGAVPVFVDMRADTLNIDEKLVRRAITSRTRAIVAMHYGGVGCELETLQALATEHGIPLLEDNAHGLFGKYRNRSLGTFGTLATHSFHETKNITCGQGGALFLNSDEHLQLAEILHDKGTNRAQFFRGEVPEYTWVAPGSNYVLSELQAALLHHQLRDWRSIQETRRCIWNRYHEALQPWAAERGFSLPTVPDECESAYHIYHIILATSAQRKAFIEFLDQRGVNAVFHYVPLHSSPMGRQLGGDRYDCPVTEDISSRLVRLPLYNTLTDAEQGHVINQVREFR